jgi:hypothetical protein
MKRSALVLILAPLIMSACAGSNPPAAPASHPPIADLSCPSEPDVTAMLAQDPTGLSFDMAVRQAGEACRAALKRVCLWHRERGAQVDWSEVEISTASATTAIDESFLDHGPYLG